MADEPTQLGTPLNKSTLLTDATANAIGSGISTVDGALAGLNGKIGAVNTIAESRSRIFVGSYYGDGTGAAQKKLNFPFEPQFVFISMSFNGTCACLVRGQEVAVTLGQTDGPMSVLWSGNDVTISKYTSSNRFYFNTGTVGSYIYYYVAIG